MALAFDTLQAAKQLQKAGITEPQEEAIVNIVGDKHEELATKSDLEILRADLEILRADLENFREATKSEFKNLRTDIENLRQETKADIENLRNLIEVYSESASKDKNWLRWAVGLNTAMLVLLIGYIYFEPVTVHQILRGES